MVYRSGRRDACEDRTTMATRRHFLGATAGMGLAASATAAGVAEAADDAPRDLYELRRYLLDTPAQREGLDAFLRDAAIPAWNRLGLTPVGVFAPEDGAPGPVHVLIRHKDAESVLSTTAKLQADAAFREKGAALIDAPASAPAYRRVESTLLLAFRGMPALETPAKGPDRVLQLRIYESPSVKTGQKKIEMFNDAGEIAIFRRVGLNPVFFGEAIVGDRLPNLTYMLGFNSRAELDASWKRFGADPEWQALRKREEYADKAILSGITNLILKPTAYSQI
jgi:hypothetical protein